MRFWRRKGWALDSFEIDRIEYDIRKKLGRIDFWVYVKVNGNILSDVLDVAEFSKAIIKSGDYPLFTCECGSITCSGYCMDVECHPNYWALVNRYKPVELTVLEKIVGQTRHERVVGYAKGELIEEVHYRISWTQVREAILQIDETLRKVISEAPDHVRKPEFLLADLATGLSHVELRLRSLTDD